MSARTLILDLVDTGDPPAFSVRQLVRAGAALGIEPTGIRTALTRLKAEGRVAKVERGLYSIGARGEPLQRRILGWRHVLDYRIEWTGDWLLAIAGPQERANRTVWRRTLRALNLEGLAEAEANVWARPANLSGGAEGLRARLMELDVAPSLLVVRASDIDAGRAASFRSLWAAAAMRSAHEALADRLDRSAATIGAKALPEAASETLLLGRQAIRAIMRDPLLPDALCPSDALARLIAAMADYDRIGKRIWRDYLSG